MLFRSSISESMRTKKQSIITNLIEPAYEKDIKDNLSWRYTWRKISGGSEGIAQLLKAVGTVMTFAAGTFKDMEWLAFVAGCCYVIATVLEKFSRYASGESKERTTALNIILKHLGMKSVPMITEDNTMEVNYNMSKVSTDMKNKQHIV